MNTSQITQLKWTLPVISLALPFFVSLPLAANDAPKTSHISICEAIFNETSETANTEPPLSFTGLKKEAHSVTQEAEKTAPLPDFIDLPKEQSMTWPGLSGPLALQELLPPQAQFVASEAPGHEVPGVVKLMNSGRSLPIRYEFDWKNRTSSTTVYATLPEDLNPAQHSSPYLIGEQYEYMIFHVHGGGTPTASGVNAMSPVGSIGSFFTKKNIPVLAPDMPGHGRGDRQPITSHRELLEWSLTLINKLVHPNVKIIFSGHSWGGELALALHRLSREEKFKRFHRIISLSPPVDTSLGGTSTAKANFEQWFQDNFHLYEDKIANSDYDFLNNLMASGKVAPVAEWFTTLTNLQFKMPPLSAEEQESLTPLLVMVGEYDGLVYVGREEEYDESFKNLSNGSQYIKMGKAPTFESTHPEDLKETGHNIFDALISEKELLGLSQQTNSKRKKDDNVPHTYTKMFEFIVGRDRISDWQGPKRPTKVTPEGSLNKLLMIYSNNFLAREFIKRHTEYVMTTLPELHTYKKRGRELLNFKKEVEKIKAKEKKSNAALWEKQEKELVASLHLPEGLKIQRAEDQLKFENLSTERKQELENFLATYQETEEKFRLSWKDPYKKEKEELLTQVGHNSIDDLKIETQTKSSDKNRRTLLNKVIANYAQLDKKSAQSYGQELSNITKHIKRPNNFSSLRDVRSELKANMSDEYRTQLKNFKSLYNEQKTLFDQEALENTNTKISALENWPEGVSSLDEIDQEVQNIASLESLSYRPPSAPRVESILYDLTQIEVDLKSTIERVEQTNINIADLEKNIGSLERNNQGQIKLKLRPLQILLLRERHKIYNHLSAIWDSTNSEAKVSSPSIKRALQQKEQALNEFTKAAQNLSQLQKKHLTTLYKSNQLNEENLKEVPAEFQELSSHFRLKRDLYFQSLKILKQNYIHDILTGIASGSEVKILNKMLLKLFGSSNYVLDRSVTPGSLEHQIEVLTKIVRASQKEQLRLEKLRFQKQMTYIDVMNQMDGYRVPKKITAIKVYEFLNQPLERIIAQLQDPELSPLFSKALKSTVDKWESMWNAYTEEQPYQNLNPFL